VRSFLNDTDKRRELYLKLAGSVESRPGRWCSPASVASAGSRTRAGARQSPPRRDPGAVEVKQPRDNHTR
jgi:hypothetical protein